MQTISLWEALATWLSGREVPGDALMGPFSILTWGRIGKVLSFVGGATVVLDLIGPDRLRGFGTRAATEFSFSQKRGERGRYLVPTLCCIALAGFPVILLARMLTGGNFAGMSNQESIAAAYSLAALGFAGLLAGSVIAYQWALPIIVRVFDSRKPAQILRYAALMILALGFLLDLLAS